MADFEWNWHKELMSDPDLPAGRLVKEAEFCKDYTLHYAHGHPGHLTMMALGQLIINSEQRQISDISGATEYLDWVYENTTFRSRIRNSEMDNQLEVYYVREGSWSGKVDDSVFVEFAIDVWEAVNEC